MATVTSPLRLRVFPETADGPAVDLTVVPGYEWVARSVITEVMGEPEPGTVTSIIDLVNTAREGDVVRKAVYDEGRDEYFIIELRYTEPPKELLDEVAQEHAE